MQYLASDGRIALRAFVQEDMAEWTACWQDETTQRGFNFVPPPDGGWLAAQDIARFPFWVAVVELSTGRTLGSLRLSPDPEHPDLAIWIYPQHRGGGWGGKAFSLALQTLAELGYRTIHAGCFPFNMPSRRILERCGFRRWPEGDEAETSVFDGAPLTLEGYRRVG